MTQQDGGQTCAAGRVGAGGGRKAPARRRWFFCAFLWARQYGERCGCGSGKGVRSLPWLAWPMIAASRLSKRCCINVANFSEGARKDARGIANWASGFSWPTAIRGQRDCRVSSDSSVSRRNPKGLAERGAGARGFGEGRPAAQAGVWSVFLPANRIRITVWKLGEVYVNRVLYTLNLVLAYVKD